MSEVIISAHQLNDAGIESLRAAVRQEPDAPILVRVRPVEEPSESVGSYRVLVFAAIAGLHDLSEMLETADGLPATAILGPIPIRVFSDLPDDAGASLFPGEQYRVSLTAWYMPLAWMFAFGWLSVPAVVILRRRLRAAPNPEEEASVPAPTLADQLRPLVAAAATGTITVREQARLEMLLYRLWRERLGLADAPLPEAIARLRVHSDAGELLRAVERWLHRPTVPHANATADQVARLLAQYADRPALHEDRELIGPARGTTA
ncbi:MAG: hypothetical protein AAGB51_06870 [Planctomycetota bacterium]